MGTKVQVFANANSAAADYCKVVQILAKDTIVDSVPQDRFSTIEHCFHFFELFKEEVVDINVFPPALNWIPLAIPSHGWLDVSKLCEVPEFIEYEDADFIKNLDSLGRAVTIPSFVKSALKSKRGLHSAMLLGYILSYFICIKQVLCGGNHPLLTYDEFDARMDDTLSEYGFHVQEHFDVYFLPAFCYNAHDVYYDFEEMSRNHYKVEIYEHNINMFKTSEISEFQWKSPDEGVGVKLASRKKMYWEGSR